MSQSEHLCESAAALSGQRAEGGGKERVGLLTKVKENTAVRTARPLCYRQGSAYVK